MIHLDSFQHSVGTTLLQDWGLILIVLGILALAEAWHLMSRRSHRR